MYIKDPKAWAKSLMERMPEIDWDSVVDPETLPDIYCVHYAAWRESEPFYKHSERSDAEQLAELIRKLGDTRPGSVVITSNLEGKYSVDCQRRQPACIDCEYRTIADAEAQVARMRAWPNLIQEETKIVPQKPSESVTLWLIKVTSQM